MTLQDNSARMESYRLHVVTWNVGTAEPPESVSSLLQLDSPGTPDLYVIGLQEVNSRPLRFISDMVYEDSWSHMFMATLGPHGYVKVSSVRMQGLLLLLFSRHQHLPFIRHLHTSYTRTGLFHYWGNKGGVSVRLSFYGHTLCFLNCHLMAHDSYALHRVDEFEYILDTQEFSTDNTPSVLDHQLVFWFGDLNFRISDHGLHFLRTVINNHRYNLLWDKDQLMMMRKKEAFLQEFDEGPLCFQPTYKFCRFSDTYDTSGKKRKPAWTDRILWRVKPGSPEDVPLRVALDTYTCAMQYGVSDHKPVTATFTLQLQKMNERPAVRVWAEGEWGTAHDPLVSYTVLQPFCASTWDWIGLYRADFRSATDYITYAWVKDEDVSSSEDVVQVCMKKEELPQQQTECVLCYYSYNNRAVVGISSTFPVCPGVQVSD